MPFARLARSVFFSFAFLLLSLAPAAHADDATSAAQAALDARDSAIVALSSATRFPFAAQEALNATVDRAVSALRAEGFAEEARIYAAEWEKKYSDFLVRESLFGLGDHRPLLGFLTEFYGVLEQSIGAKAAHAGILGDIYDLNYAIPVALTPRKGEWRTGDYSRDLVEYRAHFTPIVDIAIYWGSLLACERILESHGKIGQAKKLCPVVSNKLRGVSHAYLGPKLSDYVFARANGRSEALGLTDQDLGYVTPGDLLDDLEGR